MRHWAWTRLTVVVILFALGAGASLFDWHRYPPTALAAGASINMRNVAGDLAMVLWLYAVELIVACAALQPWRGRPDRGILGGVGILFGLWAVFRWGSGLHSPPVMFAHDVLMLLVAFVLCGAVLVYGPSEPQAAQ